MKTEEIREKLVHYLQEVADDEKVKAIYTIVEDDINTQENEWDELILQELKKRTKLFEDPSSKKYTWEEAKQAAIEKVKGR